MGASTAKQDRHLVVDNVKLRFLLSKSVFAGKNLRLEQNQKTAERLIEKTFSAGVWLAEATSEWNLEK